MKKIAIVIATISLVLGLATVASATNNEPKKVIVCKYVGTPGVDERLQTGDNPIQVSQNAIPGFNGTFPFEFADAHDRSLAVRFAVNNQDRGTLSDCPVPENPPECPNGDLNGEAAGCDEIIVPPPPPPCPDGKPNTGGKDGKPGNDACKEDEVPPVVTPPVVTPPVVEPPVVEPPVETTPEVEEEEEAPVKPTLEEELEEQAKENEKAGRPERLGPEPKVVDSKALPHTGLPLWAFALMGAGMVGTGLVLRRS